MFENIPNTNPDIKKLQHVHPLFLQEFYRMCPRKLGIYIRVQELSIKSTQGKKMYNSVRNCIEKVQPQSRRCNSKAD